MSSETPSIEALLAPTEDEAAASLAPVAPAGRTAAVIAVWAFIAVVGTGWLMAYHVTPTAAANDILASTGAAHLGADGVVPGRSSLVMVVHPLCPCSRASLHELATLAERWDRHLAMTVIFSEPALLETDSAGSSLWKIASVIPHVKLVKDADGTLARRLGAKSSGQTFLYDPLGNLEFSGGITPSRGEVGENAGVKAIEDALDAGPLPRAAGLPPVTAPVYGCSLE